MELDFQVAEEKIIGNTISENNYMQNMYRY